MKVIETSTGRIFVDVEKQLEFLAVGDYGKENNIKAEFLGLSKEIHGVKGIPVDKHEKLVATISTQKGCPMRCQFCDCPSYGFHGNVTEEELGYQIETILQWERGLNKSRRFNVHYARMGEPTWNPAVLSFTRNRLKALVGKYLAADTIHPVVSTMLPKNNKGLWDFLQEWCKIKVEVGGEAGLQFSINSTDEHQRDLQFGGMSLPLGEIADRARGLPKPVGRKYTLNFAVTESTILDAGRLSELFDSRDWIVKITPIHETNAAVENGFDVTTSYSDYDVYRKFELPLLEKGWDVIVFVPSVEEDRDRITCGNALIAGRQR